MTRIVVPLKSARSPRIAGGKGAGLAWLIKAKYPVPPGFVITPAAFGAVAGPRCTWTLPELEQQWKAMLSAPIPPAIAKPILCAYRALGGPVAVRSSMVGEDDVTASFAGQLDTVLNVTGEEELLQAVRVCWASVFNERVYSYALKHGAMPPDERPPAMAVVVQRMAPAAASGVAFSHDPVTGEPNISIEATKGLGEALVQGRVTPDRYVVDARNVVAERLPVQPEAPVLTDDAIVTIARLVRKIARDRSSPQDIEWTWDGQPYLLQARPITTIAGKTIYSNRLVSDMVPGIIRPLIFSTNTAGMARNVFGRIFDELLGPGQIDSTALITLLHSRVYANMTLFGHAFERLGLPANFFEWMSRDEHAERGRPPLNPRKWRPMLRLLCFIWRNSRAASQIAAFVKSHDLRLVRFREASWDAATPGELLAAYEDLAALHRETQWYVFIGPVNMSIRNRLLSNMLARHAPDVAPNNLVRGLVGLKALEPMIELQRLARAAARLPPASRLLMLDGDHAAVCAHLRATPGGGELLNGVDALLRRYGFLSASGTNFAATPWAETPALVWRSIARLSERPPAPPGIDNGAVRERARREARRRLGWLRGLVFDRLLDSTITYIDLREHTSLLMSEESYHMRRIFLALADHLVRDGYLAKRTHVFNLTYFELRAIVGGRMGAAETHELVRSRAAQIAADEQIELPSMLCGDAVPSQKPIPEALDCLVGIGGSTGRLRGRAQVVLDPFQAPPNLTREDILVVPFTDVSWTSLLSTVGGVVAETGGRLSHTSIVAREYGLPAVVSVKKATRLIRSGSTITIDGDQGRVYLA